MDRIDVAHREHHSPLITGVAAAIWAAIALSGLLVIAGPSAPDGAASVWLHVAAGVAIVAAAVTTALMWFDRKPWHPAAMLLAMGVDVAVMYLCGGALQTELALPFTLLVVFAAYFLPRRIGLTAQVAIAAVLVAPLIAQPDAISFGEVVRVAVLLPALFVVATLVRILRERVESREHELELQSGQDPTSGLLNARGFERMLDLELLHARRNGLPVRMFVFDVRIDDRELARLGEARAIRVAGRALAGAIDSDQQAGRLGRMRFACSGPDWETVEASSRSIAAIVRARLASLGCGADVRVGTVTAPQDGRDARSLLARASELLAEPPGSGHSFDDPWQAPVAVGLR